MAENEKKILKKYRQKNNHNESLTVFLQKR